MSTLFDRIFSDGTERRPKIGVHAMGAYLDEYGRGGIRAKELIDELRLENGARKDMYRLLAGSDDSTDKTAFAMQVEMVCMIEEVRGPNRQRFNARLFGNKRTVTPLSISSVVRRGGGPLGG